MNFLRINGAYFTSDNKYMIKRSNVDNKWDIYKAYSPFRGEYHITFTYLTDAKNYIKLQYKKAAIL